MIPDFSRGRNKLSLATDCAAATKARVEFGTGELRGPQWRLAYRLAAFGVLPQVNRRQSCGFGEDNLLSVK